MKIRGAGLALLAFWLAAGTARADSGYAYAAITGGASPAVVAADSLNSDNGAITVTHNSTGSYTVTFSSSGIGTGWTVLAAPLITSPGVYCTVASWGNSAANITCYGPGGAAKDNDFTVLAVSNVNDKKIAFAWAGQPSVPSYRPFASYAYNPSGTITITRSAVGTYQVSFQGLSGSGGTVQITAYGGSAQCNSNGWSSSSSVNVRCFDPSGNPVDSQYDIAVIPPGAEPAGLAYSYSNSSSQQNYNPTGLPASVAHLSLGAYTVTYYGLSSVPVSGGTVMITADSPSARCQTPFWTSGTPLFAVVVNVACYDTAGNSVDAAFEVLVLPPMGYANALVSDGANGSINDNASVNPGAAAVTMVRASAGKYTVMFPNSGIGYGWVVHAWAAFADNQCSAQNWIGGNVVVECYTPAGTPVDTGFDVLAISNTNQESMAFALASQPLTASYAPENIYSYNPTGAISISRLSQGEYSVVFHGLDGTGGTVQVSSYNTPNTCYSGGWNGPDFTTTVLCVDPNGAPADTPFLITVISKGAAPPDVSYAWASEPTTSSYTASPQYSYTPSSGSVKLSRLGTGKYNNNIDGGWILQATAYGTPPSRCTTIPNLGYVQCDSVAGAAADSLYDLLTIAPIAGVPDFISLSDRAAHSAAVNTAFVLGDVNIQVIDGQGFPVPGLPVQFSAPTSGPSGTFSGGASSVILTTDGSGTIFVPSFTANSTAGSYSMTTSPLSATIGVVSAALSLTNLPLIPVTLATSPTGLPVSPDGSTFFAAPYTAALAGGSQTTIVAQSPVAGAQGIQYVWQKWSDAGAISHSFTVPNSGTTLTATYKTQYQLTAAVTPAGEGSASTAGNAVFFDSGASAGVSATPNAGYRFNYWAGNVANTQSASTTVLMTGPGTVTAHFALACNLLGGNSVTAADGGKVLGRALGQTTTNADMNSDGVVNVVDIQIVLNAALQLGCLSQ